MPPLTVEAGELGKCRGNQARANLGPHFVVTAPFFARPVEPRRVGVADLDDRNAKAVEHVAERLRQHGHSNVCGPTDMTRRKRPEFYGRLAPIGGMSADFYDPASGRLLASVPIPQTVLARDASRQWSVQEV